jgi:protein-S-isoprenylcysteine O-methyltransferase Ste14
MPLSEHEQRLLEQIERALYAEDPKFASTVRGGRLRKPTRRRRLQGVAVFVVGLVLLVVGVAVPQLWLASSFPVLSVVGFLVMLGGAVLAVTSVGSAGQAAPAKTAETDKNRFTGRMEERFRRRFEQE